MLITSLSFHITTTTRKRSNEMPARCNISSVQTWQETRKLYRINRPIPHTSEEDNEFFYHPQEVAAIQDWFAECTSHTDYAMQYAIDNKSPVPDAFSFHHRNSVFYNYAYYSMLTWIMHICTWIIRKSIVCQEKQPITSYGGNYSLCDVMHVCKSSHAKWWCPIKMPLRKDIFLSRKRKFANN